MSRLRAFLANPYKIRAAAHRLLGRTRLKFLEQRLVSLKPWNLPERMDFRGDPIRHFRERTQPRFFFSADRIPQILKALPPAESARISREAQALASGVFTFRAGPSLCVGLDPQALWESAPDPDWRTDLHRLDWLNTLLLSAHIGQEGRHALRAGYFLCSWVEDHPPGSPPWEDPFEVAQRMNTLCWTLFLGAPLEEFPGEAILAAATLLLTSAYWTEAALEYSIPNNHLLLEALRLAQVGLLFPEFPHSPRWLRRGTQLLEKEVLRQVLPDGVHGERSTFYQRMVLEGLLEIIRLHRLNGKPLNERLSSRASGMAAFLAATQYPDGSFPLLNDGFDSDVLLRCDVLLAAAQELGTPLPKIRTERVWTPWLLDGSMPTAETASPLPEARLWRQGGYAVFGRRTSSGMNQSVFDFGPFGMDAAPGHGHADCLSLNLSVAGKPVLIDPGSFSWSRDEPWRQAFRSTFFHNTVRVDQRNQTPLRGMFGSGRPAEPKLHHAVLGTVLRLVDASHDGYFRRQGRVLHRRLFLENGEDGWIVLDLLNGKGTHGIEVLWHFHPECRVETDDSGFWGVHDQGAGIEASAIASGPMAWTLHRGELNPPAGWSSFESGVKVPSFMAGLSGKLLLPAWVATVLTPRHCGRRSFPVRLTALPGVRGIAATAAGETYVTTIFVAQDGRRGGTFGPWRTDARVAVIREGSSPAVILVDGQSLHRGDKVYCRFPERVRGAEFLPDSR